MTSDEYFQEYKKFKVTARANDIGEEEATLIWASYLHYVVVKPQGQAVRVKPGSSAPAQQQQQLFEGGDHNFDWEAIPSEQAGGPSYKQVNALHRYYQNGFITPQELGEPSKLTKYSASPLISMCTRRRTQFMAGDPNAKPKQSF